MSDGSGTDAAGASNGWRTAAGLFVLASVTAVAPPTVLVAIPLLVLVGLGGVRALPVFALTVLAMVVVVSGPRDGVWFAERGWALTAAGGFAALSLAAPAWRVTSRSLVAVLFAAIASGALFAVRSDAWASIDWAMADRVRESFATWIKATEVLRGGDPLPAVTVSAAFTTAELLVDVFPAMIALESMAAIGVAWWVYLRVVYRRTDGLGPLGRFRFNDHLVWLMITGLMLVVARPSEGMTRVGANLAVFMGALYALRGLGVIAFVSGGLTLSWIILFALGFLLAAPAVIGFAVLLGIADTWLDLRVRYESMTA